MYCRQLDVSYKRRICGEGRRRSRKVGLVRGRRCGPSDRLATAPPCSGGGRVCANVSKLAVERLHDGGGDAPSFGDGVAVLGGPFPDGLILVAVRPARGGCAAGRDTPGGVTSETGGDCK